MGKNWNKEEKKRIERNSNIDRKKIQRKSWGRERSEGQKR
jgi:hypothetical protein